MSGTARYDVVRDLGAGGNVTSLHAGIAALVEAASLRYGRRGASAARARRYARLALGSAPVAAGMAERALAYVADHRGRADLAIGWLERAERAAERHGRPVAAAIARYQLGLRLGGAEHHRAREEAKARLRARGVTEALLDEDPAMRGCEGGLAAHRSP